MSRVLISESTGAAVYVFSDDHCPPHVHARHRGDGWIARVGFSYVGDKVNLMSIAPLRNVPLQRIMNQLLDDIRAGDDRAFAWSRKRNEADRRCGV